MSENPSIFCQDSKTVIEYANLLQSLWQELDYYPCIETKCPEDVAIMKKFIERDQVLAGLNALDQVKAQILHKEGAASLYESRGGYA